MNQPTMKFLRVSLASLLCLSVHLLNTTSVAAQGVGTQPDVGLRSNPPSDVLLRGAHVVLTSSGEHRMADILISDGRIAKIAAKITAPAGVDTIDLTGKYIYPAFIDAFVEFGHGEFLPKAGHWNDGITPQMQMSAFGDFDSSKLESLRKTGIAIALAAPDSGMMKGQSCVIATGDSAIEQNLLRDTAMQHMRLYPSRRSRENYPNSPMGAVALLRQTLADTEWYLKAQQAVTADPSLEAPEYNAAFQALAAAVRGSQHVMIDGPNELYALRADRLAREFSLKAVVRGSGREYRQIAEIAGTNRTFIIPVDFPDAPEVKSTEEIANTTLQTLMHWKLAPGNPAALSSAGIKFAISSDGLDSPADLLKNVRIAVQQGLSETAALQALTETPAKLLGVDHLAGTIARGKLANLIITDAPIFEESSKVLETWVIGQRNEWEPTTSVDLRGEWELSIEGESTGVDLELSGTADKLKGVVETEAIEVDEEDAQETGAGGQEKTEAADDDQKEQEEKELTTKLDNLVFDGYQLSGVFNAGKITKHRTGVATLSAAVLATDDGFELAGTIRWADGGTSQFEGQLEDEESDDKELDEESDDAEAKDADEQEAEATDEEDSASELTIETNFPLGAYGLTEQPEQPEWVLVKGATIWTSGPQGILENADLLVHNGLIDSVGTGLKAPKGAKVIDGKGLHVSPGIIDCHSHMATDGGVNESGQAITAEVRIGDFIDPNDINIYLQLAGGVTTSNILHGSANPIGGQNQVIKLRWGSTDEELKMKEAPLGIKFALGENVKRSSSDDSTRYPRTRMGVEQIMRDRFEAAKLYQANWSSWRSAPSGPPPRRDYELDAIAEILSGQRWIHCHSYRQDEILAMLRTLDDYGVTIGSLQHILEGYKVADTMAAHGAMGSSFSDWWAYKFEVYDAIAYNGALMHNAGVVVSFNSDDRELARHLNHEAAKAVKYGGVPEDEALKFVTLNPAKQLRIEKWVGSLEPGKQADFVIWNRSPLSTLSMCTQTWVDGRKYFDREDDLKRREQDAQLHHVLVQSILDTGAKMGKDKSEEDPSTWWARHDEFCHHAHDDDDHISNHSHDDHSHEE